ncbi:WD40-repeat-containing domain protein [Suillus occidentalis]|nr:WD40-repeat-containing domain protein [Suillus occidentalis]
MSSHTHKLEPEKAIKVNRDKQSVPAIAFLFKDQHIITLSHDGSLQVIETRTGTLVGNPWQYDKEKSQVCAVDVSPDGGRVATGSTDGKIRVWKKHDAASNCVCWSRHDGGAYIASGFDDGSVAVWPSSRLKEPMRTGDTRLRYIHAINFSHDGTQLLVSGYDREISRLTVDKKAREVQLDDVVKICNNPNHVSSATWATTRDRHAVVTGLTDGKIMILELPEGRLLELKGPGHSDLVCAVALYPDKRVLASASHDCTLRFWDLHAKRTIGQPLQLSADLTCATFAANGTLVATGTCDGEVYIWDIADFLSSAIPMEDVNGHDGDATAGPLFNPNSSIPTRQREARPRLPSIPASLDASSRTKPITQGFFDGVRPAGVNVPTPSVRRRVSISQHVKVAASRMQQVFRPPRTHIEMLPMNAYLGGIQEESQQNHHAQRVEVPIVTGRQQSGAINEPTAQGAVLVRRTRWVNALLRMGCIPQCPD